VPGPAAPKNPNPTPRSQPNAAPTISNRKKGHPHRGDPSPATTLLSQKGEQKANRERLRLETVATRTKQMPEPISNREKEPVFSPRSCSPNTASPIQKGEQKANREALRLETAVNATKQKPDPTSNREKEACFSAPVGEGVYLPPELGLGVGLDLNGTRGASETPTATPGVRLAGPSPTRKNAPQSGGKIENAAPQKCSD
jgi:hypothetical protein